MKKGQLRQLVLVAGRKGIAVFLVLALGLRRKFPVQRRAGVEKFYLGLWFLPDPQGGPHHPLFRPAARRRRDAGPDGGGGAGSEGHPVGRSGRITDVRTHEDALALTETGGSPLLLSSGASGEDFVGQPLPHLLSGHGGPDPGAVCEVPRRRAGHFRGAEFQRKVRAILPKLKTGFEEQLSQLMASGAV